ncbi:MAG: polysaccharide pyruvyl transferase family protein [Staphylococcus equorum]|nr:polysaccharide pyruvyl transferase family protein [Staphylococcus equorum]
MAKKIAILTQPLINNYGGILQNYALQYVLKEMGYNPITLDRRSNKRSFLYKSLSKIKHRILNVYTKKHKVFFTKEQIITINANSTAFINKYILRSELISNEKKLERHFLNNEYDTIIVGSDQVWRPKYSPNIYNFFIDFKTSAKNKIAYAVSFGTDQWEFTGEQTLLCKKLIKQFNAISVREKAGVELCSKYLNVKAEWLLDPTLLLKKEDYIKLIAQKLEDKSDKGIYTYILDKNKEKKKIIEVCAKNLNMLTYSKQPKESLEFRQSNNILDYVFPPIEDWIKGFYDADFVITDSFHGTVFSIIFNKPFIVIANKERGLSRFLSLLSLLNLDDRLIYNAEDVNCELLNNLIDYEIINRKLDELKEKSFNFIQRYV